MKVKQLCALLITTLLPISFIKCQSFQPQAVFEQFYPVYKVSREGLMAVLGRTSHDKANLRLAKQMNMIQEEIPLSVPFPCNVTGFRSEKRPRSVHQVRPGDIDVIGALGDSLTAGFGLVATNIAQVFMENRGLAWSIGGQGTWRQYMTLPNILKEFNPKLFGYSLGDSFTDQRLSQFNPAEGAAISSEIPYMAKILIKRITMDKRIKMKKDWKLITVMFGANDFCLDMCFKKNMTAVLEEHRRDLITVLRLLRDNLPRTIVNLVPPPHLKLIIELKKVPDICEAAHRIECYCLFADQFKKKRDEYYNVMTAWQKLDEEIANLPEFHGNDFALIFQPFLLDVEIPNISKSATDFSYMSKDCFHLSQKMNAKAATALWNNMLERIGRKSTHLLSLSNKFFCPTEENPYIFTEGSS